MALTEDVRQSIQWSQLESVLDGRPAVGGVPLINQQSDPSHQSSSETTVRSTGRWRGVVVLVLISLAVGLLAARPSLLLVAAVGVVFVAAPQFTRRPDPDLSISRELSRESDADDRMAVETTLRNTGDRRLVDCRIIDGVPSLLSLTDGSARCATTLAPGESVTLSYSVEVRPGRHRFQPTTILCRDASGALEVETTLSEPTEITSAARLPTVPLAVQDRHRSGPLSVDSSGEGIEFHSVEEYTPGDPPSRIDWRRFARSRELRSVSYHPERIAELLVCIDARASSYRASNPGEPHAVAHSVEAAGRLADTLFESTHRVGLAAVGRECCLLEPGRGTDHEARFHQRLSTDPALSLTPPSERSPASGPSRPEPASQPDIDRQLSVVSEAVGSTTQLLLVTPLADEAAVEIATRFVSECGAVTVISPDVTNDRTDGQQVARIERAARLTRLRRLGVPVVDWDPAEPLGSALESLERRLQ